MKNYANKIIDIILEGKPLTFANLGIGKDWPEVGYPDNYEIKVQNPEESDERTATDYGDLAVEELID